MTEKQLPKGRIMVEVFDNKLPQAHMSGDVSPRDVQFSLMSIRRAFHDHLSAIGKANKDRVSEKDRLARKAEDDIMEKSFLEAFKYVTHEGGSNNG